MPVHRQKASLGTSLAGFFIRLVPTARLELAQLSPLPPQDSVSTKFTTSALAKFLTLLIQCKTYGLHSIRAMYTHKSSLRNLIRLLGFFSRRRFVGRRCRWCN